ncbi:MAG: hypothetical protein ACRDVP_07815, partial [Acidimicrobiales bacterium]
TGSTDFASFHYRPEISELAQLVTVAAGEGLGERGARVIVEWDGGRQVAEATDRPQPLPPQDVEARFHQFVNDRSASPSWWSSLTQLKAVADCSMLFEAKASAGPVS